MKIKFKNGSILESIELNDCKRSKRAIIYYYKKNPYKFMKICMEKPYIGIKSYGSSSMCLLRNGDNYGESRREDCKS